MEDSVRQEKGAAGSFCLRLTLLPQTDCEWDLAWFAGSSTTGFAMAEALVEYSTERTVCGTQEHHSLAEAPVDH